MMGQLLEQALAYHERGWSIIPVKGKEPAVRSWKCWQSERPDPRRLESWFGSPGLKGITGLAVVAGGVSGDLVIRDYDLLESYQRWAKGRPDLAGILPTIETRRGRHVLIRSDGITGITKLGDGELRGAGYSLLPPSIHPEGAVYRWQVPLPVGPGLPLLDPFKIGLAEVGTQDTQDTQDTQETHETQETQAIGGGNTPRLEDRIEAVIQSTLPAKPGQRNKSVFNLARTLKGFPEFESADPNSLRSIVQRWHTLALPIIETKPFDDSWAEFVYAWPRIKKPKGKVLAEIMQRVLISDPPEEALQYEACETRLLITLCFELQRHSGNRPFFLGARTAAELIGVGTMTAHKRLNLLVSEGVLQAVDKGNPGQRMAAQWRYVGRIHSI